MVRVLVVDEHPAIRRLLHQLLSQNKTIRVVAKARSGREALDWGRQFDPDVMTLDMMLGDLNGLQVLNRLKAVKKSPKVIVISLHDTPQLVRRALDTGAGAYIVKKELTGARLEEEILALMEQRA